MFRIGNTDNRPADRKFIQFRVAGPGAYADNGDIDWIMCRWVAVRVPHRRVPIRREVHVRLRLRRQHIYLFGRVGIFACRLIFILYLKQCHLGGVAQEPGVGGFQRVDGPDQVFIIEVILSTESKLFLVPRRCVGKGNQVKLHRLSERSVFLDQCCHTDLQPEEIAGLGNVENYGHTDLSFGVQIDVVLTIDAHFEIDRWRQCALVACRVDHGIAEAVLAMDEGRAGLEGPVARCICLHATDFRTAVVDDHGCVRFRLAFVRRRGVVGEVAIGDRTLLRAHMVAQRCIRSSRGRVVGDQHELVRRRAGVAGLVGRCDGQLVLAFG
ncbi:hypothetical protein D3C81_273670 [compost metagenome]